MDISDEKTKLVWTNKMTKSLINSRLSRENKFIKPKCKKIKIWAEIAAELNTLFKNTNVNAEECDNKFRNLMKTYKANKKKQCSTGEQQITWDFFEDFDKVYGCKAAITPPHGMLHDTLTDENEVSDTSIDTNVAKRKADDDEDSEIENIASRQNKTPKMEKRSLPISEYLFRKLERDDERQKRKEEREDQRWKEEMELRRNETNALLKLAEALAKQN